MRCKRWSSIWLGTSDRSRNSPLCFDRTDTANDKQRNIPEYARPCEKILGAKLETKRDLFIDDTMRQLCYHRKNQQLGSTMMRRGGSWQSLHPIFRLRRRDRLPPHIAGNIRSSTLERLDVIDHVTWTGAG